MDRARAYYHPLMGLLGYELFFEADDQIAFMPGGGRRGAYIFFYPSAEKEPFSRHGTGLQHLAFIVSTRTDVARVHAHVLSVGGEILHAPQVFAEYPPPYFATFWLDPFGMMLEAVCHRDRD